MENIKVNRRNKVKMIQPEIKYHLKLMRFIREIEREEFLDHEILKTMIAVRN